MHAFVPVWNWSVLDCFRWICKILGSAWLSTARSDTAKCSQISNPWPVGTSNSSSRKNPPQKTGASHCPKHYVSEIPWLWDRNARIWGRMAGVIGRWGRDSLSKARILRTPFSTTLSLGIDAYCFGSGRPCTIWTWRIAAKYVLIVWYAKPLLAKYAT